MNWSHEGIINLLNLTLEIIGPFVIKNIITLPIRTKRPVLKVSRYIITNITARPISTCCDTSDNVFFHNVFKLSNESYTVYSNKKLTKLSQKKDQQQLWHYYFKIFAYKRFYKIYYTCITKIQYKPFLFHRWYLCR